MIWITWETQRRTVTLARCLDVRLHILLDKSDRIPNRIIRYAYLFAKTFALLVRERPAVCGCQNPSMMLAIWLTVLRPIFRYSLVVDRHSNFNLGGYSGLMWRILDFLSDQSIRHADLTIVTNEFLASRVRSLGGRAFVLQDRIPQLTDGTRVRLAGSHNFVFVCSYDEDEPITEAVNAATHLDPSWHVYVTGNYKPHLGTFPVLGNPPANVTLTGFLDDAEYQTLLRSADAVIVLTNYDHTLMCGAYEAVSLGLPCVASNTSAMRAYFRKGFVFTENSPEAIADAVRKAVRDNRELRTEVASLGQELDRAWQQHFTALLHHPAMRPALRPLPRVHVT